MSEEAECRFYEVVWMWIKLPHVFVKRVFSAVVDSIQHLDQCVVVDRRLIAKSSRSVQTVKERIEICKNRCEAKFELSADSDVDTNVPSSAESNERDPVQQQHRVVVAYKIALVDGELCVESLDSTTTISGDEKAALFGTAFVEHTLRFKLKEFWKKNSREPAVKVVSKTQALDGSLVEPRSLTLVDHVSYYTKYIELKSKYAQMLAANWCERTSPEKFIHEELAIAAYIITFWSSVQHPQLDATTPDADLPLQSSSATSCSCAAVRSAKISGSGNSPTFVDLGCGNGMLVFVLNSEGYAGVGVDVRERRSWNFYRERIGADKLVTMQLNPAEFVLGSNQSGSTCERGCEWPYAACQWLIGNHADELTCWLPVLASRFAHAGFFLLPCCSYELSGVRFSYRRSNESLYRTFLRYVDHVARRCGYDSLRQDRLRIPSTKRICYVASNTPRRESIDFAAIIADRDYHSQLATSSNFPAMDEDDASIDDNEMHAHGESHHVVKPNNPSTSADVIAKMQLRATVEPVRNCAGLPLDFRRSLLSRIVTILLSAPDAQSIDCDPSESPAASTRRWNAGGRVALDRIAAQLTRDELQLLKAQCGGLQTFVRNHRHVVMCDKTIVSLSRPIAKRDCDAHRQGLLATRPCWFATNHPDGCPHSAESCACSHSSDDTAIKPNTV